jgi:hypothetical protein
VATVTNRYLRHFSMGTPTAQPERTMCTAQLTRRYSLADALWSCLNCKALQSDRDIGQVANNDTDSLSLLVVMELAHGPQYEGSCHIMQQDVPV